MNNDNTNDLYAMYLVEGISVIPYPILDSMFLEIYGIHFKEWQKRLDLDFPEEQVKKILKEKYRDWRPTNDNRS